MLINISIFILAIALNLCIYYLSNNLYYNFRIITRLYKGSNSKELNEISEVEDIIKADPNRKLTIIDRVQENLDYASLNIKAEKFLKICSSITILASLVMFLLTKSILLSILVFLTVIGIMFLIIRYLKRKRVKILSIQLLEVVDFLSGSLKSGYSFMQCLNLIVKDGKPPASEEFKLVIDDINIGKSYEEAFDKMYNRNPIVYIDIMATAILISKESGGNLSHILDIVSTTIYEKERLDRQIKGLTAPGRLTGTILVLLPIGVFLLLGGMNPSFIKPLITSSLGRFMLMYGIISQIVGGLFISKLIKVDR